jgi:hypothetical protein
MAKNRAFAQTIFSLCKNLILTLVLEKDANFFRRKSAKIVTVTSAPAPAAPAPFGLTPKSSPFRAPDAGTGTRERAAGHGAGFRSEMLSRCVTAAPAGAGFFSEAIARAGRDFRTAFSADFSALETILRNRFGRNLRIILKLVKFKFAIMTLFFLKMP